MTVKKNILHIGLVLLLISILAMAVYTVFSFMLLFPQTPYKVVFVFIFSILISNIAAKITHLYIEY